MTARPSPLQEAETRSAAAGNGEVAILQCTLQGEAFLAEQLESIAAQTYADWRLCVSDDGSSDGTLGIIERSRQAWGEERVMVRSGPARGFAANFLSLACAPDIDADYYAYADQDDIWEPDKLKRAVEFLKAVPAGTPALYCSRTCLVDEAGQPIGLSPLHARPPSFANALVHCVGGGNTMVFNQAARDLLRRGGDDVDVVTHDWWTYLVVAGCGGQVFYDPHPTVCYRQHAANLVGSNIIGAARLLRLRKMFEGVWRGWIDRNLAALARIEPLLTPENRRILDAFRRARQRPLVSRVLGIRRAGLYHQTRLGSFALLVATLTNKL